MSKKIISFLGMGNYSECIYVSPAGSDIKVTTRFVQEALVRTVCKDFKAEDSICIFLTNGARAKNWESCQSSPADSGLSEILHGLKNKKEIKASIKSVSIPDGTSEKEIWEIFSCLYECISENDSVILDITHAFRSIPMLGMVALNYAHYLKKITIDGIYYGAYEARNKETNEAPVLDLTSFYELMQWTSAADSFTSYGRSDKISALVEPQSAIYKGTKKISARLDEMISDLNTVRGKSIVSGKIFTSCADSIEQVKKRPEFSFQPAFEPLLKNILDKVQLFNECNLDNIFTAIHWYLKCGQIQQAVTLLQEGIITYTVHQAGLETGDRDIRELCAKMFQSETDYHKKNNSTESPTENTSALFLKIAAAPLLQSTDMVSLYENLTTLRNSINHGGFNSGDKIKSNTILKQITEYVNRAEQMKELFHIDSATEKDGEA